MRVGCSLLILVGFLSQHAAAQTERLTPPPLSTDDAIKMFKVYPGFEINLMVAEPLVTDPVAFNWSADGRLWVVCMGDYPLGADGKNAPGGSVRVLEDSNGDGAYDKSTVFLDHLSFPTGVTPFRKGVLVACAPDIFYAEDTDSDGKADKREVLFTGFAQGNPQRRLQGLAYGLDNWFYGASGEGTTHVKSAKTGKTVDLAGRDFRLNPDTGEIEPVTGRSQSSRARDDLGNWFSCDSNEPCQQILLEERYLRRNPRIVAPLLQLPVPEIAEAAPVYPISKPDPEFRGSELGDHFTSAFGLTFGRDDLYGSGLRGNSFVSEPAHNLIHREVVWQDGLLAKSRRADDEHRMEFVSSSDPWFRPTMLRTGPDGGLWIADMYRAVIEHPDRLPKIVREKVDLRAGHDKGRLYRVHMSAKTLRPIPNLAKRDVAGLVASLDSPGGWERDMAQQLLVERQDKSAAAALEKLAASSQRALARVHALCTLEGIHALTPATLIKALDDPQPGVRMHAVRLAETQLDASPELAAAVAGLATDPDAAVRLQVACSLGEWHDPKAIEGLVTIARRDAKSSYAAAAVMSSITAKTLAAFVEGVTRDPQEAPSPDLLAHLVRMAIDDDDVLVKVLGSIANPPAAADGKIETTTQFAALARVMDALEGSQKSLSDLQGRSKALDEIVAKLIALVDSARETVIDDTADPAARVSATALLARTGEEQDIDIDLLAGVLVPQTPENVQSAAIAKLIRVGTVAAAKPLLAAWPGMTPALRVQSLDALVGHAPLVPVLLKAVEDKAIPASDLAESHRRKLLEKADAGVRENAKRIFAAAINPDRAKVIDQFRPALSLKGDVERGKAMFSSICATCHKVGDLGVNVGPDLRTLPDHSGEYYLLNLLDPNRAVDPRFTNYVVESKNGQMYSGVVTGDSGLSVTVTGAGGKPQTVLRAEIKRLRGTPLSAMPEGLEIGRSPQEFADLIAFITNQQH